MEFEPIGKYKRAQDAGYVARDTNVAIEANPNQYGPDKAMASWWDTGWQKADREIRERFHRVEGKIIIGRYLIEERQNGGVWISMVDDGEGGEFDAEKLEAVIDDFYKENF